MIILLVNVYSVGPLPTLITAKVEAIEAHSSLSVDAPIFEPTRRKQMTAEQADTTCVSLKINSLFSCSFLKLIFLWR